MTTVQLHIAILMPHSVDGGTSGDRRRTVDLASELSKHGLRVTLIAPHFALGVSPPRARNDVSGQVTCIDEPVFVGQLRTLKKLRWQVGARIRRPLDPFSSLRSREVRAALQGAVERIGPDVVDVQHTFLDLRVTQPTVRTVHNVESSSSGRRFTRLQRATVRRIERRALQDADQTVVFTHEDLVRARELAGHDLSFNEVAIGVGRRLTIRDQAESMQKIAFIGSFDYQPNNHAGHWMIDNAAHIVQATGISKVVLIGRKASQFFEPSSLVEIRSDVDSIADACTDIDLLVIPLAGGGGMRVKIIDAMRLGIPIVATQIACEGIDIKNGEHAIVVPTVHDIIPGIRETVNLKARSDLAKSAQSLWEARYSSSRMGISMLEIYKRLILTASANSPREN